jgi:Putative adhesin
MATYVRTQEIAHDIGARGRFALRVTSPDVELRAGEGTVATVRIKIELRAGSDEEADELFERLRFRVREGDGLLEVSEPRREDTGIGSIVRLLGIGDVRVEDSSVTAEIPRDAEIVFEGVSTDVTASGFRGSQAYRTVSGDLVLARIAGDLRVRSVSADVSIRADDPMRLELNTVSGDVSAIAPRFDALRLVTVSGDVELEGEFGSGQHRVETVSGDLSVGVVDGLTLEVRGLSSDTRVSVPHRSEGSRDRRRYIIGGGDGSLLFSSMSGDASVRPGRHQPAHPAPPRPPAPPAAPTPPTGIDHDEQLETLRALEAGEIGVDEAAARLAGGGPDA